MTSRERFLAALNHEEADRIPIDDTPWVTTVARWHREGLPAETSPRELFGYERWMQGADVSFQWPAEVLEETDHHVIRRDSDGVTVKTLKDDEMVPQYLDYTIRDRRTWEQHRDRLLWNDSRVDWEPSLAVNRRWREEDRCVIYACGFGYDRIQRTVATEVVLAAMIDEPDWVKDMMEVRADLVIAAAEAMMARGFVFDAAFLWNDQAYRNGPFFSPAAHRSLEFPAQQRMCDFFHQHGLKVILHSDGNIWPLIPSFIEAGFDCLQPLEVKAGMDLVELKEAYGDRLSFMGGIDVRAMAHPDPAVIEAEVARKIPVAKRGGGYIYHSDHSVPDNVSFAQYRHMMDLVHRHGTF